MFGVYVRDKGLEFGLNFVFGGQYYDSIFFLKVKRDDFEHNFKANIETLAMRSKQCDVNFYY